MFSRIVIVMGALLLVSGCVSKGKYRGLEEEYGDTRSRLEQDVAVRDARIEDLEASLAGCEAEEVRLRAEIEKQQGEIARLSRSLTERESRIASLLSDRTRFEASVSELETLLADASRRQREAEKRVAQFRALIERFRTLIDAGQLRVRVVDGRMVLELPSDVLFPSGSAQLSDAGRRTIDEIARVLTTIPDRRFQVEGHTDSVPISNERFPSNWYLGAGRSLTVVNTMIAAGLSPERISAASFGEYRPAATNETVEGKALNRRIEIVVVPDLSDLPGYEELRALEQR